jgi:anaerobic magnesium-protoporphyrin IX monomethyl ester cyclase
VYNNPPHDYLVFWWRGTRVALVYAESLKSGYEGAFGIVLPPLAAASLASVARESGFDVRFFDARANGSLFEDFVGEILDYDPDVTAFIVNASTLAKPSIELASELKRVSSFVVAGGHHATFTYPLMLRRGFDVVFLSEGEISFGEFLKEVKESGDWRRVKGIAYRDRDNVVVTGLPDLVESLDELPMPAFEIFDKEIYKLRVLDPDGNIVTVETSRGCPYNCEYCSVTKMWGATWRFKSVERVLAELRRVLELGYKWVFIVDDNFIVPIKRIIDERVEMLRRIISEGLNKLRFLIQLRADFVARNEWLPPLLYEAGVRVAFLGIESGDAETLKNMRKGLQLSESTKAVKLLSSNGIIVHGGFMLGAPYEDEEAMSKTIKFAVELIEYGLDSAQFSIYTPLPGTDAFNRAALNNSLLTLNWDQYDCLTPVMRVKIPPYKLYLKQRWANYYFFVKKALKAISKRTLFSKPRTEKDLYLANATKFVIGKFFKYLKDLTMLPFSALKVQLKLRRGLSEEEKRDILEIIEASKEIMKMHSARLLITSKTRD